MKKMKRICALALAGIMAASLAACGSKNEGESNKSSGGGGLMQRQLIYRPSRI